MGRYLRGQRLLRGISLDDLAVLTKLPRRSLERLESGVFDHISDGFSRGFVRAVADALGLDPNEAVLRLLAEPPEEDDARARAGARRRFVLGLGLAVALTAVLLGLWAVRRVWVGSDWRQPTPVVVYRRDVVRSMATAQSTPGRNPGAGSASVLPVDSASQ
ncbi:MAG: helix-turn-helix domain-containing protein [Myxococcales bacterium]|nr:helix-turn-helix domain-containing protein [Myxococcales bacterium]